MSIEPEFVDAEKLIEWIEETQHKTSKIRNIIFKIKSMPDAVVRCKDCIYMKELGYHANCRGYLVCRKGVSDIDFEDYCSKGERA